MGTMKGASNPQQMLLMLANKNPNLKNILTVVAKHNGDPKAAFYSMAKEQGVNPDDIINALKQQ